MADAWVPQEETYKQIKRTLSQIREAAVIPPTGALENLPELPDFNNYLLLILLQKKHLAIWDTAALVLKYNFGGSYSLMERKYQNYLKSDLLHYLKNGRNEVKDEAGWMISEVVKIDGFRKWPKLLSTLAYILDKRIVDQMTRSMTAILKICENAVEIIEKRTLGISIIHNGILTTQPIDALLPRMIECVRSDHNELKMLALEAVSRYAKLVSRSRRRILESLLLMREADNIVFERCKGLSELLIADLPPEHLDGFLLEVTSLLKHPNSRHRRMACSILGQLRNYLVKRDDLFKSALMAMAESMDDSNSSVQEDASVAFSLLFQDDGKELAGNLEIILRHLTSALENQQTKSLYAAIGKLAKVVGSKLDKPAFLEGILVPTLKGRWICISTTNEEEVLHWLQCVSTIALACKSSNFACGAYQTCLFILGRNLQAEDHRDATVASTILSLELLRQLTETFGRNLSDWDAPGNWLLLLTGCKDDDSAVCANSFALVAYLAMAGGAEQQENYIRALVQECKKELNQLRDSMFPLPPELDDVLAAYL